jgi:CheY-like chemotaxis protein
MPHPEFANITALIADDRADVRNLLTAQLREMGVAQIDAMAAVAGGTHLLALLAHPSPPADPGAAVEPLPAAVSRFSHDVASPLMCVLALTGLLVREARVDEQTAEDLKRIQAAAEEIALMVRTLGERAAPRSARRGNSFS